MPLFSFICTALHYHSLLSWNWWRKPELTVANHCTVATHVRFSCASLHLKKKKKSMTMSGLLMDFSVALWHWLARRWTVLPKRLRSHWWQICYKNGVSWSCYLMNQEKRDGSQPSFIIQIKLLLVGHVKISWRPVKVLMIPLTMSSRIKMKTCIMFPSRLLPHKSHLKSILRITLPSGSLHHHVTLPQSDLIKQFWPPKLREILLTGCLAKAMMNLITSQMHIMLNMWHISFYFCTLQHFQTFELSPSIWRKCSLW